MSFIRYLLIACLTVVMGCALASDVIKPPPQQLQTIFIVILKIDPNLPTLGLAEMRPGSCIITLRTYPICLLHEIRHCTEGQWHGNKKSSEDCY